MRNVSGKKTFSTVLVSQKEINRFSKDAGDFAKSMYWEQRA